MNLLLAPHFDDETLFASFICLREKPLVVFCFDGAERHGSFETRWAEAQEATRILGCEAIALREEHERLADCLCTFDLPDRVWAPLPEEDGNADHNFVGVIAEALWRERVTFYSTYTGAGRTQVGEKIDVEPGWEDLKQKAMLCYRSQRENRLTRAHFERGLNEYELVSTCV